MGPADAHPSTRVIQSLETYLDTLLPDQGHHYGGLMGIHVLETGLG